MSSSSVQRLNLYNFFAVLLPGTSFVILLVPLLPEEIIVGPVSAAIPLIAVGFVIGQALHTVGATVQSFRDDSIATTSHRELFARAVNDDSESDTDIPNDLIEKFRHAVDQQHGVESPDSDSDSYDWMTDDGIKSMYGLVRSQIHADGRGRSRVFQSIYAFSRSILLMIPVVGFIYVLYASLATLDVSLASQLNLESNGPIYTPAVASTLNEPLVVLPVTFIVAALGWFIFTRTTEQYKRYYVEYTLADYVVITDEQDGGTTGEPPDKKP